MTDPPSKIIKERHIVICQLTLRLIPVVKAISLDFSKVYFIISVNLEKDKRNLAREILVTETALDDPLVHFDASGRENTRNLLQEVPKKHQVLIFSCHDHCDDWANQVISL